MTPDMPHVEAAEPLAPVGPGERIGALDLLRGWALFGVLWSNLNASYGTRDPVTALDRGLAWAQDWMIQDRFYDLLIVLFGVGFGIQLTRAVARGMDLRATYYRRSAALLAIGIVHGTLVWSGDILTIYALVAFALVMFRTATTRQVLVAALLFWFIAPSVVMEAKFLSGLRFMVQGPVSPDVLADGSWLQIQPGRVAHYLRWLGRWGLSSYVTILGAYLMGLWAVKSGYLRRVFDDPATTRRLLIVALAAAAVGFASNHYFGQLWPLPQPRADGSVRFPYTGLHLVALRLIVVRLLGWETMGLAIAYACLLLLAWQRPLGGRVLRPVASVGRMALTTYLTQSVVCTLLFYGYGLGWYGRVGYTGMLMITVVLFACQVAASSWWLRRHRFGPAEWVWRRLTYPGSSSTPAAQAAVARGQLP